MIIESFTNLEENKMKQFLDMFSSDDEKCFILFTNDQASDKVIDIGSLRSFFEKSFEDNKEQFKKFKVDKVESIYFMKNETDGIRISHVDLAWWSAQKKRLDKLFGGMNQTTQPSKHDRTCDYKIEVATINFDENGQPYPDEVEIFTGDKKSAVVFINQAYRVRKVKSFFKLEVMFKINDSEWKTIEELKKEGYVQ